MAMKKYCLLFFVVTCLYGCSDYKSESVFITGNIKGLGNDTICVYGVDDFFNFTDTIYVVDDEFSYTIQADTVGQIILCFNHTQTYPVFFDKRDKITIEGDVDCLNKLVIKGNLANESLGTFLRNLECMGQLPPEKRLEAEVDSFIHKNPSSPVSVYLLDTYFVKKAQPDYGKIKQLMEAMTGQLRNKPYVEKLKAIIDLSEKAEQGKIVPSFGVPDTNGKKTTYTSLDSKYILIHFWASQDDESRFVNAKLREVNRIYKRRKKQNDKKELSLLGISFDVDKESWKQAIKKDTLTWKQVCDLSGWNSNIVGQYAIEKLPSNILISSTGKVIARNIEWDSLSVKLSKLLKEE
jgi:peroxiredoxin